MIGRIEGTIIYREDGKTKEMGKRSNEEINRAKEQYNTQ